MRFRRFALLMVSLAAPATAREAVGSFATWAAFCDEPKGCYALSVPAEARGQPFLSIVIAGATPLVRVHLGRPARASRLMIGDLRFELETRGEDAVADTHASRRIVAAIREGETLTMVGRSAQGTVFRHHYNLLGAPSAIDAAMIASLR